MRIGFFFLLGVEALGLVGEKVKDYKRKRVSGFVVLIEKLWNNFASILANFCLRLNKWIIFL